MNKISDYLVDIVLANYNKDRTDGSVHFIGVALEALTYLETERHYDKLLRCMFDYCTNNLTLGEDEDERTGEVYGRPFDLLFYLSYVNKDKLVEAIWDKMGKENDENKRRQLEQLLERIGEVKIWE